MVQVHSKSLRKRTTGLRFPARKKKNYDLGGTWPRTTIGEVKRSKRKTKGAGSKSSIRASNIINVSLGSKTETAKIVSVIENAANPHFVRRNLITRGAVLQTDKGYVRVTSSPGQVGVLNGIMLKNYTPKHIALEEKAPPAKKA